MSVCIETATTTPSARTGARALAIAAVVLVALAALGGIVATVAGAPALLGISANRAGPGIGDAVRTPFGTIAVTEVGQLDGVTNRALGGASHGVGGLVDSGHITIQTTIALANDTSGPVLVRAKEFRLRATRGRRTEYLSAEGGDLPNNVLTPRTGLSGHLDFTAVRQTADLALVYTQPGHAPIVIDVGKSTAQPRAPGDHTH